MRTVSLLPDGIVVSGSGGFIGKHLNQTKGALNTVEADIERLADLDAISGWKAKKIIHLAGVGRVVTAIPDVPHLFEACLRGTVNLLDVVKPETMILASSCAIYGNTVRPALPTWEAARAASAYGLSKSALESLVGLWAIETGKSSVCLRLGNVVGPGCGGLIPYLVNHAVRNPDGQKHASMRGGGKIRRDYVPVEYVVSVMLAAANAQWEPGVREIYNVGTGLSRTNGDIAQLVREFVEKKGLKLNIDYRPDPATHEAHVSQLDVSDTTKKFGIQPPNLTEIDASLAASIEMAFQLVSSPARD